MSIDGGTTWQNAFHNLASRRGPRVNTVPIPQAASEANVKVRWRYRSTFGFWWEVDNAFVGNRTCDPIPGGLVVGNVFDTNTSDRSQRRHCHEQRQAGGAGHDGSHAGRSEQP